MTDSAAVTSSGFPWFGVYLQLSAAEYHLSSTLSFSFDCALLTSIREVNLISSG